MSRWLVLPLACLCGACSREAPLPSADPVQVERLVARIDAAPKLPAPIAEKVEKADRIAGTVTKVQADKIDPAVVAALISR